MQVDLYVCFDDENKRLLTLREVLQKRIDLPDKLSSLTDTQMKILTLERFKLLDKFEIYFSEAGLIDKQRAMQEIEKGSKIGKRLIRIELKTIQKTFERYSML